MGIKYSLGMQNKSVRESTKTSQFALSEKIMDFRCDYVISLEQMCKIIGVDKDRYVLMEFGDKEIPIDEYLDAINRLKQHLSEFEEIGKFK